mmetsp:Transcript_7698/g.11422  ORF Transcript_7698/g.11422 Transcript_7698/m.11422 type:complete len:107 (+) Transcript_7698:1408-1728(+)
MWVDRQQAELGSPSTTAWISQLLTVTTQKQIGNVIPNTTLHTPQIVKLTHAMARILSTQSSIRDSSEIVCFVFASFLLFDVYGFVMLYFGLFYPPSILFCVASRQS